MSDIIKLLDKEREAAGMTAEQFAVMMGVPSTSYSRQKHGKQHPNIKTIQNYATFARERGNIALLRELGAYVLNLAPDAITIKAD
jgi:transcriptional regulator with XRE-family HTH domain